MIRPPKKEKVTKTMPANTLVSLGLKAGCKVPGCRKMMDFFPKTPRFPLV